MNTPPEPRQAVVEKVQSVLQGRSTMFLGTAENDAPWVAGTFFAESDPFTLSIVLETTGRTLSNIRANPDIAVVVSSGAAFEPFLQGEGQAVVLTDEDQIEEAKNALRAKAPEIEPLLQIPIVAVSLRIRRWLATDVPNGWLPAKELLAPESITVG